MVKKFDRSLLPAAPDLSYEKRLWKQGITVVAGIDEAGRGALAGPVTAAVIIFPKNPELDSNLIGVRDSKRMTPRQRELWAGRLVHLVTSYAIGFASSKKIDQLGILPATYLAAQRAISGLPSVPEHLLVDYIKLPGNNPPQTALVKGDARSLSIAAASILAKVSRDDYMRKLDDEYPGYGFGQHKGYGTVAHRQALADLGPCPVHRQSFQLSYPLE